MAIVTESTDEQLASRWRTSRDVSALDELRKRIRPLVQSQVNKYRSNAVPMAVISARADKIFVDSVEKYRPGTGATFRTFLFMSLKRLNRFSTARSNIASIPEARAQKIGVYQRVYESLSEEKRRPPTTSELADELNWPPSQVLMMQRSTRRDIASAGSLLPTQMEGLRGAREARVMEEIWYELAPDEQRVFSLITGRGGARRVSSGGGLAMATGFSQAKVSLLRKSIARKMEPHL